MNESDYIKQHQNHFEHIVNRFLPNMKASPDDLHPAMLYAVASGGKRLRPLLVYATGELMGGQLEKLDSVACCVEFIHAYSLIHDDLPAMDDADFRRGKPACHKVFGEATAILAGNALQSLAFEVIAKDETKTTALRIKMINILADVIGTQGVLGGQMLDLKAQKKTLNKAQVEHIHRMKTAALIAGSVQLGALAANCEEMIKLNKLEQLAYDFGLAFQIGDDILDKGESALNLVNQIGLNAALDKMNFLYHSVFKQLLFFTDKENPLYWVINYIRACHQSIF